MLHTSRSLLKWFLTIIIIPQNYILVHNEIWKLPNRNQWDYLCLWSLLGFLISIRELFILMGITDKNYFVIWTPITSSPTTRLPLIEASPLKRNSIYKRNKIHFQNVTDEFFDSFNAEPIVKGIFDEKAHRMAAMSGSEMVGCIIGYRNKRRIEVI